MQDRVVASGVSADVLRALGMVQYIADCELLLSLAWDVGCDMASWEREEHNT